MTIPDYQTVMLPFLQFLSDEQEHSYRETVDNLADHFQLTEEERKEMLPSGTQEIFNNRVGWARTYLKHAGLIEPTRRGHFKISSRGLNVLKEDPPAINIKFLDQFEEFREFKSRHRKKKVEKTEVDTTELDTTPEEALENAYENLRNDLATDLLQQIKSNSPSLFEKIVVELLVKMGYGGSRKDAGKAVGKTKDEGIDGIIKEDRLGLDIIYIQAKRWENTVSRPEIQKFAGALQGQRAKKGIFITTSNFSKEAHDYAERIETKIVLIDGDQLAQLMIDNNVGVTPVQNYEIKRIDSDYFTEE
jgi:restriction system protein